MLLEATIALFGVAGIAITANYFEGKMKGERSKISLKESMDLAQVPVITFQEGDRKLNFLVDSGSSESHISKSAARELLGTPVEVEYDYIGSTGSDNISKMVEAVLKYKENEFKVNLMVNESLDESFAGVKESCGVQLHGLLGSDFLREHKYILDFAELVAYHK